MDADLDRVLDAVLASPSKVRNDRATAMQPSMAQRLDGWFSALSGIGTVAKDKTAQNAFCMTQVTPDAAEEMWRTDDLSARVIEVWPNEMLREGFRLKVRCDAPKPKPATPGDDDADPEDENLKNDVLPPNDPGFDVGEVKDAITKWWSEVKVLEVFLDALQKERAFGGSVIFLGVKDGRALTSALNEETVREFTHLTVFDVREVVPMRWQNNVRKPNFGEPTHYQITPHTMGANPPASFDVHASRLITFGGIRVSRTQSSPYPGFGDSVLNRPIKVIGDYNMTWNAVSILMHDFAQAIFKMKGLAEAVAADGDQLIKTRWEMLEMSRSVARAIVMDSEEEFERKPTPLTGLSDVLEKFETRVAAAVDMPVTLLFGRSPGGLNATGESDIRFFYDRVSSKQSGLVGLLERITRIAFNVLKKTGLTVPEKWSIEFNPLWQETAKEQAETRKLVAETDAIYITSGVLFPEEVARDRYGSDEYSPDTCIDFDARVELERMEEEKNAKEAEAMIKQMEAEANVAGNAPPPFGGKPAQPKPQPEG